ncbi:hypothetical protein Tco_0801402 [Tanacetum coccineum]|uniref:Uncharacterized protein n=1 Tax=Tanacetum coccineum TaxID=301880 RepID=A0ABQ4ZVX9_9ASTR
MEDDLFTYKLEVVEDFYFPYIEQPHDNLTNDDLDAYELRWLHLKFDDHRKVGKEIMEEVVSTWLIRSYKKQLNEYMEIKNDWSNHNTVTWYTKNALWLYWIRGDDEEVLTNEVLSNLEEEKLMTMLQEYWWRKKEKEELSDDAWSHYSPIDEWKDYEHTTYIETDVNVNQNTYNNVCQIFKDHAGMTNDDAIQGDHEWFDEHEPMEDDDDISDLDDYLITNDAPYFIDEQKERSKERRCKLLGIPYVKPPTCKSKSLR